MINQSRRTLPLTPKIILNDKKNFVGRTEFMKRKFQKDNERESNSQFSEHNQQITQKGKQPGLEKKSQMTQRMCPKHKFVIPTKEGNANMV